LIPFSSCVVTKFPWNKTDDTPGFTGLPINVIRELKSQFQVMMDAIFANKNWVVKEVCNKMEQELDLWLVGGEGYGLSHAIDCKINLLSHNLIHLPMLLVHRHLIMKKVTLSLKHVTLKKKLSSRLMRGHPLPWQTIQGSRKPGGSSCT